MQSFFSFSPRISQGCNASRQSSDILSGRCQLTGKDFTSLALLLSGLLLLGAEAWAFFAEASAAFAAALRASTSSRADASSRTRASPRSRSCSSGLLLLGGRSLSSLQSFFSFSPRISQGCNASRQSSDILSGRCQLMGKDFTSLALLLSGLLLLGGRSLSSLQSFFSFSPRISQGCNASRQSSDILSGRCQLMGKNFNFAGALAQRPASARRPKPRAVFAEASAAFAAALRASTSSRANASSWTRAGTSLRRSMLCGLLLLGGRSLGSLQSFFSFSQGCNASRQSSDIPRADAS